MLQWLSCEEENAYPLESEEAGELPQGITGQAATTLQHLDNRIEGP